MLGYNEDSKPIKNYKVVRGDNPMELSDNVAELLRKGWKLQGGVSCMLLNRNYDKEYYQAMVRK